MDLSVSFLKNVLDNVSAPIVVANKEGKYIYANKIFLERCELPEEMLIGGDVHFFLQNGYVDICLYDVVMSVKHRAQQVQRLLYNDVCTGERAINAEPIFDRNGEVEYIVYTNYDLEDIWNIRRRPLDGLNSQFLPASKNIPLIYRSKIMDQLLQEIDSVAQSDAPVLLFGETGTGKEVLAHRVHDKSARNQHEFVVVNCASIPESMLEMELFGYEKGSFTGALNTGKQGLIELANKGTIFFDEINSMPLSIQSKLLRVIETKQIRRIGALKEINVDFRMVSATNQNLFDLVKQNKFREDFLYRLNVIPITIPPLRDRCEDIEILSSFFIQQFCKKYNKKIRLSPHAVEELEKHSWPGNVRELRNLCERLVVSTSESIREFSNIPDHYFNPQYNQNEREVDSYMPDIHERSEIRQIISAFEAEEMNISNTAKNLGLSRRGLYNKMKRYGIEVVSEVLVNGKHVQIDPKIE